MKALPALFLLIASIAHADPRVTIESDNDDISLNQITNEARASAWGPGGRASSEATESHMVCRAPCNQTVSGQFKYFIAGDGMPDSRKFLLPVEGDATVKVDTGSNGLLIGGATLLSLGGISAMTGAIAGPITGNETAMKYTIGLGLPVAITGLVMLLKGRTTVKVIRGSGVALDLRRGAMTF